MSVVRYLRGYAALVDSGSQYIGFVLEHDYSKATLEPSQLKGKDKHLYQMFLDSKWVQLKLHPVEIQANGTSSSKSYENYQCMHFLLIDLNRKIGHILEEIH